MPLFRTIRKRTKMEQLLEVKNLSVSIDGPAGEVQAVRDVSFSLKKGEVLAIVGESGCGKSMLCKSVMKLLPPSARITNGSISVCGQDITGYREKEMQNLRGKTFSMIFQDPMTALNPTIKIGKQIAEAVIIHNKKSSKEEVYQKVLELMELVGITHPKERYHQYPWQFSGGMRQRCVMAIALAADPDILFADEPTTALDVTIQAQILDLIQKQCTRRDMSVVLITHDLAVVSEVTDYIAVMYLGEILEYGTTEEIIKNPLHPYTQGLLKSMPKIEMAGQPLFMIEGNIPELAAIKRDRCRFYDRCPYAGEACIGDEYDDEVYGTSHRVRCVRYK